MKVLSDLCKEKIMSDNEISMHIALMLDIQQLSVRALVKRNSEKLIAYPIVMFFIEKGLTIDEILIEQKHAN